MDQSALRAIRGAGISMVFQEPEIALNPVMHVRDQVAEVIHAHKDLNWKQCRANAELALGRVGLPSDAADFFGVSTPVERRSAAARGVGAGAGV